jgi:dipeptidyl aminopeptidase/acylaminoacyl peptidase
MDAFKASTPARVPFVGLDGVQPAVSTTRNNGRARLVYAHVFSDTNIWRIDTAEAGVPPTSRLRRAVASTRGDNFPALSPDGKRLAFFSTRSGELELWVGDPNGSNAVQLTTLNSLPGYPRWSPDGQTLTFHSDPEGHAAVLTIPANGGKPRIVTPGPASGGYPSYSRDGRTIYFTGPDAQGQPHVWKMPTSGDPPTALTGTRGDIPVESYDGNDLYYVESAVQSSALWRLPLRGGAATKIVDSVYYGIFDVAEKGIYYIAQTPAATTARPGDPLAVDTQLQFYSFATGKNVTIVASLGLPGGTLSTSRDGRTIFFTRIDASADELMLVDNFR